MKTHNMDYETYDDTHKVGKNVKNLVPELNTVPQSTKEVISGTNNVQNHQVALHGWTYKLKTGCGPIYLTINEDEKGKPRQLFIRMGKNGGCASCQNFAIGNMVTIALNYRVPPEQIIKQLRGIACQYPKGFGEDKILSCADAAAVAIQFHIEAKGNKAASERLTLTKGACPDCGGILEYEGGCPKCHSCGFSLCG